MLASVVVVAADADGRHRGRACGDRARQKKKSDARARARVRTFLADADASSGGRQRRERRGRHHGLEVRRHCDLEGGGARRSMVAAAARPHGQPRAGARARAQETRMHACAREQSSAPRCRVQRAWVL